MIAALYGKCGKTVITSGIARALKNRGLSVQPYKKGPDYIDPGWHSLASGKASRTLDSFFMTQQDMNAVLCEAARSANIGIIEGAMGFYDGSDLQGSSSSAEVAKQTSTPVILVLDVTRMTRTTAALVLGCIHFDPHVHIAGVIANRVGNPRHEARLRETIEHYCGIPVIGAIPNDDRMKLADRHLGLVTAIETQTADEFLDGVAEAIEEYVDLDMFLHIAGKADSIPVAQIEYPQAPKLAASGEDPVTIAVMRDKSFSFYYQENFDALEAAGAKLVFVDSMKDKEVPPEADGLYIGGGFPEVFAEQLTQNAAMRESVKARIEDGIACCAECGGLMYLGKDMLIDGKSYDMAGVFDFTIEMMKKRQGHGYAVAVATNSHPWFEPGVAINGHEHHHSRVIDHGNTQQFAYDDTRGNGVGNKHDGYVAGRCVASYIHTNAISTPQWATALVDAAYDYRNTKEKG